MDTHAGSIFTAHEMLTAYVAERLDRLADAMVARGHTRLALCGTRRHARWLVEHVRGIGQLPIVAFLETPADPTDTRPAGLEVPVLALDDPTVPEIADAVLLADDRYEDTLLDRARVLLPPRMLLFRIYHRLPIGTDPIEGSITEMKPTAIDAMRDWNDAPMTGALLIAAGAD